MINAPDLRRLIYVLCGAMLAVVFLTGGLILAFLFNFHPSAPRARYPAPASALEAQRQDLDYFSRALALDRAFSPAARAAADARLAALAALATALPPEKLHVKLMQIMALANNGHSRVGPTTAFGALILPLRITAFAEGFYVMRATAPYADMLGGRVESIDGQSFERVVPRLESLRCARCSACRRCSARRPSPCRSCGRSASRR